MATNKTHKTTLAAPPQPEFTTVTVGEEVLVETPAKALKFIMAANTSRPIRAALEARGFTKDVRLAGWALLQQASGMHPEHHSAQDLDPAVGSAITTLDATDEDLVTTVHASFAHSFPVQEAYVLEGVKAEQGPGAVLVVETVLDRVDALEKNKGPEKTRAQGKAAVALLAVRGYTPARRTELRALVQTAKGVGAAPTDDSEARTEAAEHAAWMRSLRALRAWYEEWSKMAHIVVKRRDYLARLGLAKLKRAPKPAKTAAKPAPAA